MVCPSSEATHSSKQAEAKLKQAQVMLQVVRRQFLNSHYYSRILLVRAAFQLNVIFNFAVFAELFIVNTNS